MLLDDTSTRLQHVSVRPALPVRPGSKQPVIARFLQRLINRLTAMRDVHRGCTDGSHRVGACGAGRGSRSLPQVQGEQDCGCSCDAGDKSGRWHESDRLNRGTPAVTRGLGSPRRPLPR